MALELDPALLWSIVVGGVSLVVVTTAVTTGTARTPVGDEEAVRARFALDFPELSVDRLQIAPDGLAALLELAEHPVGVVFTVGDEQATRVLGPGLFQAADVTPTGLRLRLADFGAPTIDITLPEADRDRWLELLRGHRGAP